MLKFLYMHIFSLFTWNQIPHGHLRMEQDLVTPVPSQSWHAGKELVVRQRQANLKRLRVGE